MKIATRADVPNATYRNHGTHADRFIHRDDMEAEGYGAYLDQVEDRG